MYWFYVYVGQQCQCWLVGFGLLVVVDDWFVECVVDLVCGGFVQWFVGQEYVLQGGQIVVVDEVYVMFFQYVDCGR